MKIYVFFVLFVGALGDSLYEDGLYRDAIRFINECGGKRVTLCLKEKALKFIERLPNNIDIGNGIRIKQSDSERLSREYTPITSLPNETEEREALLDRILIERIVDYLRSHTLELKIPMIMDMLENETETEEVEEARRRGGGGGGGGGGYGGGGGGGKKGKGGKRGGMGALMMMVYMKSAAMYAIGLKVVGAMAFKALITAKVALTIAAIVALKKLMDNKGQTSTYEVIAHNAHEDHDRVYSPAELMYRGHRIGKSNEAQALSE